MKNTSFTSDTVLKQRLNRYGEGTLRNNPPPTPKKKKKKSYLLMKQNQA
jgi:hypothetical protein